MDLMRPLCDVRHGAFESPEADVDFGRYVRVPGLIGPVAGKVRFLCDHHARGLFGSRDPRYRLTSLPPETS